MNTRDWPMQEIVRLTGTTSRTLRHYQQVAVRAHHVVSLQVQPQAR